MGGENVFFCGLGMCLVSTVISGPATKKMVLSLILIISHNEDHGVDDNVHDSSDNDDETVMTMVIMIVMVMMTMACVWCHQ